MEGLYRVKIAKNEHDELKESFSGNFFNCMKNSLEIILNAEIKKTPIETCILEQIDNNCEKKDTIILVDGGYINENVYFEGAYYDGSKWMPTAGNLKEMIYAIYDYPEISQKIKVEIIKYPFNIYEDF